MFPIKNGLQQEDAYTHCFSFCFRLCH